MWTRDGDGQENGQKSNKMIGDPSVRIFEGSMIGKLPIKIKSFNDTTADLYRIMLWLILILFSFSLSNYSCFVIDDNLDLETPWP